MNKQDYTLAIVKTNTQNLQKKAWDTFLQEFKKEDFEEAIIIPTDREATDVNLAKRLLIAQLMANQDVEHSADYAVIDHTDKDRLLPCIVLFDPELQFAAMTALQLNPDKYFIQAVISDSGKELHVNKCTVEEVDEQFNDKVN
ncbi:hypothetical protein [Marinilabilia salmonicolor]|uniref:Uncharacterized protein n=1 Tax=Marinilabilia salmonicolor TaxID=989 RepID=A0A368VCR8_9BACT|nr:hypothetical protein [Marinilabilia salmonicolor]RCW36771.1 hypothetical protein DFO77_10762 [Marinilabilia salmonicolor]